MSALVTEQLFGSAFIPMNQLKLPSLPREVFELRKPHKHVHNHIRNNKLPPIRQLKPIDEKMNTNVYYLYYKEAEKIKSSRIKLKTLPKLKKNQIKINLSEIINQEKDLLEQEDSVNDFALLNVKKITPESKKKPKLLAIPRRASKLDEFENEEVETEALETNRSKQSVVSGFGEPIQPDKSRSASLQSETDVTFPLFKENKKPLSFKDFEKMPLSKKFYTEAKNMVFNPKSNSFLPKGVTGYLMRMNKLNKNNT